MNNTLQMMGAAIITTLCFGLDMGAINASMAQQVFPSIEMGNPATDDVISIMDGINNTVVFDNSSLLTLDHPETIASITAEHSRPTYLELDSMDDNTLITHDNLVNYAYPGRDTIHSENPSVLPIPVPGKYVIMLVGLGLIGFTLRRRSVNIPSAFFSIKQRILPENAAEL